MLHLATHMQSEKGSANAAIFTADAAGCEWSKRGITVRPVSYQPNKRDMTGAGFGDGGTVL